jgi:glutathione synthase/RimK-type ligase-like ATP-grasp enzyme
MIKVGVHVHRRNKLSPFSLKYIKILEHNYINCEIMNVNNHNFWEKVSELSHFIYQWGGISDQHQMALSVMPIIERELGIKCFPDFRTYWHHDDKIREYLLMTSNKIPTPKTHIFWDRKTALEWINNNAKFPLIFKLKSSAGSQDVVKVNEKEHALKIAKKMFGPGIYQRHIPGNFKLRIKDFKPFKYINVKLRAFYRFLMKRDVNYQWMKEKNYVYFQEFIPDNDFDTRVTIIGNRAFAFRRMNRKNDFRSSGSGIINYELDKINLDFIKLAFNVSNKFGFQSMAYDFLSDKDKKPVICEISYAYQDLAVFRCNGFWDSNLNFHEGHFWPQYSQLCDFLDRQDLKQPKF